MHLHKMQQGYTFIELFFTLVITVILLLVAIPSFTFLYQKAQVDTTATLIQRTLNYARIRAVYDELNTTICGSVDNIHCVKNNFTQLMVFGDTNKNRKRDDEERLLRSQPVYHKSHLWLQASFGRPYITYKRSGSSQQAGSFILCDPKNQALTRRITVSTSGRIYRAGTNKSHIVRGASGKIIECAK